jgi:hypothetical protein
MKKTKSNRLLLKKTLKSAFLFFVLVIIWDLLFHRDSILQSPEPRVIGAIILAFIWFCIRYFKAAS